MMMEKLVERWLVWKTEALRENLPVLHKLHMSALTRTRAPAVGSQLALRGIALPLPYNEEE
jgi:hypothetical protein